MRDLFRRRRMQKMNSFSEGTPIEKVKAFFFKSIPWDDWR